MRTVRDDRDEPFLLLAHRHGSRSVSSGAREVAGTGNATARSDEVELQLGIEQLAFKYGRAHTDDGIVLRRLPSRWTRASRAGKMPPYLTNRIAVGGFGTIVLPLAAEPSAAC